MEKILAIIPARGGSKRIPNKNIKPLNGLPLINYTIELALSNQNIDKVIVSTEDTEIAKIAMACGAEVPFMRPDKLAMDNTPDLPVILHALEWLEDNENYHPDKILLLRPTTPFKTNNIINNCVDILNDDPTATSVRTTHRAEGIDHPYWMFKSKNGYLQPFIDGIELTQYYQRQLLPDCYKINGVVDVLRPEVIRDSNNLFGDQIRFCEIEENNAVDIDTPLDFVYAEFLIKNKIF
ncbi:MAG: acylneuraminate cytidylyltransferase family protein [Bacteroidota bacterium]